MAITLFKHITEEFFDMHSIKIDYETFIDALKDKQYVSVERVQLLITQNLEKNIITIYYGRYIKSTKTIKLKNGNTKCYFKKPTKIVYSISINIKTGGFHNYYHDHHQKVIIRKNSIVEVDLLKQLEFRLRQLNMYDYFIGLFNYNVEDDYSPYDLKNLFNFILCNYYIKNHIKINHIYDINLIEPYISINRKSYHCLSTLQILIKALNITNPQIILFALEQLYLKINESPNVNTLNYIYHNRHGAIFPYLNLPLIKIIDVIKDVDVSQVLSEMTFGLMLRDYQISNTKTIIRDVLRNVDFFKSQTYSSFHSLIIHENDDIYDYNIYNLRTLIGCVDDISKKLKVLNLILKSPTNTLAYNQLNWNLDQILRTVTSNALVVLSESLIKRLKTFFGKDAKIISFYYKNHELFDFSVDNTGYIELNIISKNFKKTVIIHIFSDFSFTLQYPNGGKLHEHLAKISKRYFSNEIPYRFIYNPLELKNISVNVNDYFEYIK